MRALVFQIIESGDNLAGPAVKAFFQEVNGMERIFYPYRFYQYMDDAVSAQANPKFSIVIISCVISHHHGLLLEHDQLGFS